MALLDDLKNNSFVTMLTTWLHGELVGEDRFGNRYYRQRGARNWRQEKRWVVFGPGGESTMVPPGWVGWLHRRLELPPEQQPVATYQWEQERMPSPPDNRLAYRPQGSLERGGKRAPATGDYEAWTP